MFGHTKKFLVPMLVVLGLLLSSIGPVPVATADETITFPPGTFVIPADDKQADAMRCFGLIHRVLREGAVIYRIIEPPDVNLKTTANPSGTLYRGGPVLVLAADASVIAAARAEFPSVTVDTLTQAVTCDRVFRVGEPTKILIFYGKYGHTAQVLDEMGIPYTGTQPGYVEANPTVLLNYDLVVDDCPGWSGNVPSAVVSSMTALVRDGGELMFTDIALKDLVQVFPGVVSVKNNAEVTSNFDFHNVGEFPSQWAGPLTLPIYTKGGGQIVDQVLSADVRNILDSSAYAGSQLGIGGLYFVHGKGIVEGLAFHPQEQSGESRRLTAFIYGNKLVHTSAQQTATPLPTPTATPIPTATFTPVPTATFTPAPTPTPTVCPVSLVPFVPGTCWLWWPWLLLILAVASLITWLLWHRRRQPPRRRPTPPPAAKPKPAATTWPAQKKQSEPSGADVTHGRGKPPRRPDPPAKPGTRSNP
jgi:hypothetical protein